MSDFSYLTAMEHLDKAVTADDDFNFRLALSVVTAQLQKLVEHKQAEFAGQMKFGDWFKATEEKAPARKHLRLVTTEADHG
jgi:hypothetical protein